jgi:putative Holliday junction resolvase
MTISALGLDVGKKRVGVAACDGTGLIAFGLTTIERRSFQEDLAKLRALVSDRQATILVVGLPYCMDGSLGFQARQVQKFAQAMAKALKLPLVYVDERLTSFEAEQMLKAEGIAPSRQKGLVDRKAASLILQQWLDERRSRNPASHSNTHSNTTPITSQPSQAPPTQTDNLDGPSACSSHPASEESSEIC